MEGVQRSHKISHKIRANIRQQEGYLLWRACDSFGMSYVSIIGELVVEALSAASARRVCTSSFCTGSRQSPDDTEAGCHSGRQQSLGQVVQHPRLVFAQRNEMLALPSVQIACQILLSDVCTKGSLTCKANFWLSGRSLRRSGLSGCMVKADCSTMTKTLFWVACPA